MIRRTLGVVAALALSLGCDEDKVGNNPAGVAPIASSSAETAAVASAGSLGSTAALQAAQEAAQKQLEGEARALLTTWLESQNGGKFKEYSELYADKFQGVKRVGSRTFQFDRKGWLKDREALFQRPATVSMNDLVVSASGVSAVLRFKQTWQTSTFKDVGTKQLILVKEQQGLRISREEMLSSDVGAGGESNAAITKNHFLLRRAEGRIYAVMAQRDEHNFERIVEGQPRSIDLTMAIRPVKTSLLSPQLKALRAGGFELYGAAGRLCSAPATFVSVLAHVVPHFGQVARWNGEGLEPGEKPLSKPAIATELWRLAAGSGRSLVFELEASPACEGALVARSAAPDALAVTAWKGKAAEPALVAAGLAKLRALPAYREIQKQFELDGAGRGPWDAFDGAKPQVKLFESAGGGGYLLISAVAGAGCGGFVGDLFTVWKLQPGPVLLGSGSSGDVSLMPSALLDLDGDGSPEFLNDELLFVPQKNGLTSLLDVSPPNFDCGC